MLKVEFKTHVINIFLIIIILSLAPLKLNAQVVEEGSLRNFLLGNEPACAYDNWSSHVIEGLATEEGYNHHIPPELDVQTNGFGEYDQIVEADNDSASAVWRSMFTALWQDTPDTIESYLETTGINYELVYFSDTETGNQYRIIREKLDSTYVDTGFYVGTQDDVIGGFHHGWGIFILNTTSMHPGVMVQAPHPNDDFISIPLATDLFLRGDFGALVINGCGREVAWSGGNYNNSRSISDPTRYGYHPFQYFAEFFVDTTRAAGMRDVSIQMHSYDSESHQGQKSIQASPGTIDAYPNRFLQDYSDSHLDWINFMPVVTVEAGAVVASQAGVNIADYIAVWHSSGLTHVASETGISGSCDLPGFGDNEQMIISNDGRNSRECFEPFIHIEFDELPAALEAIDMTELDLYDGSLPVSTDNWNRLFIYYNSAIQGMVDYFNNLLEFPDNTPPAMVNNIHSVYSSDHFIDLEWSESDDPNFGGYEIYYDNSGTVNLNSPVWNISNDEKLMGQRTLETRITGLIPEEQYTFAVRGVDIHGNVSALSETAVATTIDTTLPEIKTWPVITSFPAEAWPPVATIKIRSIEPLRRVVIDAVINGEQQISLPLIPQSAVGENNWVTYTNSFMDPVGTTLQPGSTVSYRILVRENSVQNHTICEPAWGYHTFEITEGQHMYYADLEEDDGSLITPGSSDWQWSAVTNGPESGYDGDNGWNIFNAEQGTIHTLEMQNDISLAGMPAAYLSFYHWINGSIQEEEPYRVLAGGFVEISADGGNNWDSFEPISRYDERFADGPFINERCFYDSTAGWRPAVFRLNSFLDEGQVRFRFHFYTEDPTNTDLGWVIDNISVSSFPPPLPPVELDAVTILGRSIRVNWINNGADFYRVYRAYSPYGEMEILGETDQPRWTDVDILDDTHVKHYSYRIEAVLR